MYSSADTHHQQCVSPGGADNEITREIDFGSLDIGDGGHHGVEISTIFQMQGAFFLGLESFGVM